MSELEPILVWCTAVLILTNSHYRFYSIFMLFLFTLAVGMKAWFRGLAAACKSPATAQTFAGISILAMALYTGKESRHKVQSCTNLLQATRFHHRR
jgi:hypothetical protein